ncbi:hypothetical protein NDA16_000158 [Ustilago loliicola]|nr:hypothetical protein NDA16_000158 [Ustilago loliicola]
MYGKEQKSFAEIAQGGRTFTSPLSGSSPLLETGGIYIVEPSSAGDIYVLSSAKSKAGSPSPANGEPGSVQLDKLPLTLPQLVELSPFSFAGDDTRVFVGQKQTTLVELNIQTGELGAVFGGRQAGVWCGAQAHDLDPHPASDRASGFADPESCIDDEPTLSGSSSKSTSQLAYIGRTDYTLNIHSRSSPEALQTLHFSTFAPNAGDRDVQILWTHADHPDQRAILGMPEEGSVVCFNLTETDRHSRHSSSGDQDARALWSSELRASVAGVFDVVYPAPHLQNTKSLSRPILVPHPPIPLHRIFPQISDHQESKFDDYDRSGYSSAPASRRRSAYLGIAGDSLYAMSSHRFPLVAFTSKATAGLSDGSSSHPSDIWSPSLPSSQRDWAHEGQRKCASFGCWLGSYTLQVDPTAEGRLRDSLLGSHPTLEIDGSGPRLGIGDRPAFPSNNDSNGIPKDSSSSASSQPSRLSEVPKKDSPRSRRPGSRDAPDEFSDDSDDSFSGPSRKPKQQAAAPARSWKARLSLVLLQVIGVLVISVLAGATYLGLQEQKARAEKQAAEIAQGVVWIPVLKEDEAGFGGEAHAEKVRAEEERQLQQAINLSKKGAAASASASASTSAALPRVASGDANEDEDDDAENGAEGSTSNAKKKNNNKRRRRGKRGGAAVAAKAAKANGKEGSPEAAENEKDKDDEDEEANNEDEAKATAKPTSSQDGEADVLATPSRLANGVNGHKQSNGSAEPIGSDSGSSNENEPITPRKRNQHAEGKSSKAVGLRTSASALGASDSLQRAQQLMSPQLQSPLLNTGWGGFEEEDAASVGRAAAQIAATGSSQFAGNASSNGVSTSSLTISDEVLGYGSSGTVVFRGTFQGRAVAVKRLLRDFVHVASKEVSLLESADNHPNVIRYFYKELTPSFLFIALELCPASLAEVVERPADYRDLSNLLDPKRALHQITSGLRHLHSLSIVHRDIKPQNILVATSTSGKHLKMLLSDFGLSKRLDGMAQTSFSQTVNNPGGTVGWRAPEILRGDVNLDAGSESESSMGNNPRPSSSREEKSRLTRAVDIFALGCLAYYVLSNGDHPFGSRFEREMNIIRKRVDLSRLDGLGEEGHEAQDLVLKMVSHDPRQRPSAAQVLTHPYFWDPNKRLNFLQDASDRFEIMEKDPPTAALVLLESRARNVLGTDWHRRCDKMFLENLGKFRKYDPSSVQDLLRAMRNKKHHYQDLPPTLKKILGSLPDGYLNYFTRRFPELFLHVYNTIVEQPLIRTEPVFREYFHCAEPDH